MWLDTDQAITPTTESGEKSKSNCAHPRACRLSPSMPRPGITRPATKYLLLNIFLSMLFVALVSPFARAQNPIPAPPPPPGASSGQQNLQPDQSHRLTSTVDLVVLHATVVDEKGQFVTG